MAREQMMEMLNVSVECGKLDACINIVNKLYEVTEEEKHMITSVLQIARGRLYIKANTAYHDVIQMFHEVGE